jgi:hypothetical protein
MFRRYLQMLDNAVDTDIPGPELTGFDNLRWMCRTALEHIEEYPIDKTSRWLGFVQGILVIRGFTSVQAERDFSRPLFHAA